MAFGWVYGGVESVKWAKVFIKPKLCCQKTGIKCERQHRTRLQYYSAIFWTCKIPRKSPFLFDYYGNKLQHRPSKAKFTSQCSHAIHSVHQKIVFAITINVLFIMASGWFVPCDVVKIVVFRWEMLMQFSRNYRKKWQRSFAEVVERESIIRNVFLCVCVFMIDSLGCGRHWMLILVESPCIWFPWWWGKAKTGFQQLTRLYWNQVDDKYLKWEFARGWAKVSYQFPVRCISMSS